MQDEVVRLQIELGEARAEIDILKVER